MHARQGEQPPRPVRKDQSGVHEARSHRRDARHMYAGLSIADEKVSGTCRRRTRVVDVQTCVHDVIIPESLPRKVTTVLLMVDHGTTHAPTHLLRQHEGVLRFQVRWVPPNASWLDQIDSWFSMLQRTYVPPTHVVSPTT